MTSFDEKRDGRVWRRKDIAERLNKINSMLSEIRQLIQKHDFVSAESSLRKVSEIKDRELVELLASYIHPDFSRWHAELQDMNNILHRAVWDLYQGANASGNVSGFGVAAKFEVDLAESVNRNMEKFLAEDEIRER